MNTDKPCLCPKCGDHMKVNMPIWVTPGDDHINTDEIDWDSGNYQCSNNWYCGTCSEHHFPLDNEATEKDFEHAEATTDSGVLAGSDGHDDCRLRLEG